MVHDNRINGSKYEADERDSDAIPDERRNKPYNQLEAGEQKIRELKMHFGKRGTHPIAKIVYRKTARRSPTYGANVPRYTVHRAHVAHQFVQPEKGDASKGQT